LDPQRLLQDWKQSLVFCEHRLMQVWLLLVSPFPLPFAGLLHFSEQVVTSSLHLLMQAVAQSLAEAVPATASAPNNPKVIAN
jgi:hypothetical protein